MATADAQQHKPRSKRHDRNRESQISSDPVVLQDASTTAEPATLTSKNGGSHRHRHRHHHHSCNHSNHASPNNHHHDHEHIHSEKSKSKSRPTKQLDFDQAMADFKTMFPTMDCEIIEAVLRANDGAVDSTIDQLLTMSIDSETVEPDFDIPPELLSPVSDDCPIYNEERSEDSPPSYTEAVSNNIWTTPISSQKSTPNRTPKRSNTISSTPQRKSMPLFDLGLDDDLELSNTEEKKPPSPTFTQTLPKKPGFRNWNPPMLGSLPDDFLRLSLPSEKSSLFTNINSILDIDEKPRVHHRRHKLSNSRSSSERKKLSQSLIAEDLCSHHKSTKLSRSMSERSPIEPLMRTRGSGSPLTSQSLIISSHEFTQGMLDKKMKENERRRRTAVMNADAEMSQYLEDERLAIMLQNSEFLQELRGNEEFMQTLERDQIKKHRKEKKQPSHELIEVGRGSEATGRRPDIPDVPRLVPVPIEEETHEWLSPAHETSESDVRIGFDDDRVSIEGYGDDRQQQLEAFPFSQPIEHKDDDAELRRKLKDMGGASRKQFMALARKFFSRKKSNKRTLKQIQKEKLAPSMMNLLDSEEDVEDEDNNTQTYNQDTEIEPLPTSLLSVPGHKYVQRPNYHPDTIVSYHDNRGSDMV